MSLCKINIISVVKAGFQKYGYVVHSHNGINQQDNVQMLEFLIYNIFVECEGQIFQQAVRIPVGTNCALLLEDLFLYSYQAQFIQNMLKSGEKKLAKQFNLTFRYIN